MEKELQHHTPEYEHKPKHIYPVGESKQPKKIAVGGVVFDREELIGFEADTVREHLSAKGVQVTNKWAQAFVERHNKKGE